MKKRFIAVLLASMMLSVTACGSGSPEAEDTVAGVDAEKVREAAEAEMKARHQERSESIEKVEEEDRSEDDKEGEASAEEAHQEEEASAEEAHQEEEASDDGYIRGEVTDTTFESEWIGLRYELPKGFTMSSEEDLDAILQAGGEILYEDKADELVDYAKMTTVYEMMAKDRYGDVITLFVEKTKFDIDTYVSSIKMQIWNVDEVDISMDNGETVEVCGVEFEKYSLTIVYNGVEMKEDYFLRKKGDRMICMLIGYLQDETAETIMSGFSPY